MIAPSNISIHWIRHTTLTWVERHYGHAITGAYAGHHSKDDTTSVYTKANLAEVATALSALTGEPHPHALNPGESRDVIDEMSNRKR